ncbi:hypothetical protein [Vibrio parahaemolyticus]|uniref:hypothetical protein n=1 Tax=Vibrio parahaemolyticus TaxID=670 RepID=UPI000407CEF7|nr:hypothetical protein [Vibrio parahaemolyticus]MBE3897541.1 hypothetical protein [Vibrio parahaemolyticus]
MKKTALVLMLSMIAGSGAYAATGDTSTGRVTFSGYVPGFVANGGFIVTGQGGSLAPNDFVGTLSVMGDGTFTTLSPVRLEGHLWTDSDSDGTNDKVGDLQAADWTVTGVHVLNVGFESIADSIVVKDGVSGTEVSASNIGAGVALASAAQVVDVSIKNSSAIEDVESIAGEDLQVAVDILATSN